MNIRLDEGAYVPTRAHNKDAGLDLYAREDKIVPARGSAIFDTGVHVQLPPFTAGLLVSKSGLEFNHDIVSDGLIDEDYTGSIHVKLFNLGSTDYHVKAGDKISQMVVICIQLPDVAVVGEDEWPIKDNMFKAKNTAPGLYRKIINQFEHRGNSGFGSTGR